MYTSAESANSATSRINVASHLHCRQCIHATSCRCSSLFVVCCTFKGSCSRTGCRPTYTTSSSGGSLSSVVGVAKDLRASLEDVYYKYRYGWAHADSCRPPCRHAAPKPVQDVHAQQAGMQPDPVQMFAVACSPTGHLPAAFAGPSAPQLLRSSPETPSDPTPDWPGADPDCLLTWLRGAAA